MVSLLGIKIHEAYFYDKAGHFIGSKIIKISSKKGISKKVFEYKGGSYNIKPNVSRAEVCFFPYFVDRIQYNYTQGNPDPLAVRPILEPLMNADDYNVQLESKILRDLNKVRQGGLAALLTGRNLIILLMVIGAIIYFATGGELMGGGGA